MKTVIIDKSLVDVNYFEKVNPSDVYLYTLALKEAGADYLEIDFNTLARLPKPVETDKYIYRVEKITDAIIANNLPFSYAVLPLSNAFLIPRIKAPIVLEVNAAKFETLQYLETLAEGLDLSKVSLLRIVCDFDLLPDELSSAITKFRSKYAVPIDLCPLNNSLTALTAAVSAYAGYCDSITLSFGNSDNYCSLEEFLITLVTMYKIIISKTYISGICKAAILSTLFSKIETDNLKALMKQYGVSARVISIIDSPPDNRRREIQRNRIVPQKTVLEKRLINMELDKDLSEQIVEIMKECTVDLFIKDKDNSGCLN